MLDTKPWYMSKQVWLNVVGGLCLALVPAVPALGSISTWVGNNVALIGVVWSGLGILLRLISKDKIQLGE